MVRLGVLHVAKSPQDPDMPSSLDRCSFLPSIMIGEKQKSCFYDSNVSDDWFEQVVDFARARVLT